MGTVGNSTFFHDTHTHIYPVELFGNKSDSQSTLVDSLEGNLDPLHFQLQVVKCPCGNFSSKSPLHLFLHIQFLTTIPYSS